MKGREREGHVVREREREIVYGDVIELYVFLFMILDKYNEVKLASYFTVRSHLLLGLNFRGR